VAEPFDSERSADDDLRSGVIAGIAVYLIWGFLTLYWKLLSDFDPIELIGWRILSAGLIMAAILTVTRRWRHLRILLADRALLARVAGAAVLLTINWTAYVWAVVHDQVIQTALGYFMAPLGTILIGVVVFKEHLRVAQRIAVALAVISLVILTISFGKVPWLALAIAISWSVYGWMKKRVPLTPLESMSAESLLLVVPAIVVVSVMSSGADSVSSSAGAGEIVLVALTGVATALPLMMFAWAAQRVPLTLLGPDAVLGADHQLPPRLAAVRRGDACRPPRRFRTRVDRSRARHHRHPPPPATGRRHARSGAGLSALACRGAAVPPARVGTIRRT
jgi:chloramphenicol-sensitive protein RarD